MITALYLILVGGFLGWMLNNIYTKITDQKRSRKLAKSLNNQYEELLVNIKSGDSSFKARINNIVYINTKLKLYGDVTLIYLMDKQEIGVLKESEVILVQMVKDNLSDNLKKEIIDLVKAKYNLEINDTINILGSTFSKSEFEKTFGIKFENLIPPKEENTEIEKIISKNDIKFNIDDILDKINKVGIRNLTKEENQFLNNFSK